MPKVPFNDQAIAAINVAKTTWYTDSNRRAVRGLRLMAGRTTKTWYLTKRRRGGKVEQVKIGRFPEVTVEQARRKAGTFAGAIEDLPKTGGARLNVAPPTLAEVLEMVIERNMSEGSLAARTAQEYRDVVRIHTPEWLDRPLAAISTRDVQAKWVEKATMKSTSNKLIRTIRQVYKYAMLDDEVLRDPTRVIRRLHKIDPRQPKCDDLRLVMADVRAVENPVRRICWELLLHTGIRTENLRTRTWDNVNLEVKTVHLERMKNGESRTLPLSDHSAALFEELRQYDEKWCFPTFRRSRSGHIHDLDTLPTARQHDMRHHFSSVGARCHVPEYALNWLRGDAVRTQAAAMAGYLHNVAEHETANRISAKIIEESK